MLIAFAGSPAPAAIVLRALVDAGQDVAVVISQPDRPRGRGGKTVPTPVSAEAERLSLLLRRPPSINDAECLDELMDLGVRAVCVVGFGQILRDRLLETWPCLNVHFSILPAYRGAAPVERALMDGCAETGVTIMQMDAGLDTGPIISIGRTPVAPDDDAGALLERLAVLGGELLVAALVELAAGRLVTTPQPDEGVSLAPKIAAGDLVLDPTHTAVQVVNRIRALSPHIGAACLVDGQRFKVWKARTATGTPMPPGSLRVESDKLLLECADGPVEILELQPPNRSRMDASAFLRGWRGGLDFATVRDSA
jgi:methionyl-tRNA formyltransferase